MAPRLASLRGEEAAQHEAKVLLVGRADELAQPLVLPPPSPASCVAVGTGPWRSGVMLLPRMEADSLRAEDREERRSLAGDAPAQACLPSPCWWALPVGLVPRGPRQHP